MSEEIGIDPFTDTWNDEAVEAVSEAETLDKVGTHVVYAASKTEAERKAWDFVAKNKPGFVLNTVLPNYNASPLRAVVGVLVLTAII